jgi:hypothetical protein
VTVSRFLIPVFLTLALSIAGLFNTGLSSARAADGESPPVESLMTPEDFSASGLDKLTDAERAHLSEWLVRYRQGATEGPAPPKTPEQRAEEREIEIAAKVVPAFKGWSGKTIFRLDNGQIWRQRQPGKLRYSGDDSTVVIYQNLLGGYMLKHNDSGRAVGVKRIE